MFGIVTEMVEIEVGCPVTDIVELTPDVFPSVGQRFEVLLKVD